MVSPSSSYQNSLTDPSLRDLSERYGFTPTTTPAEVQRRLKEEEDRIRKEIQKELKLKEGAENLRRASTVQKTGGKSDISAEIKKTNTRLEELNQEREEIRTFQLMMSDGVMSFSSSTRQPGEDGRRHAPGHDTHAAPETDSVAQTLAALENRLNIELKMRKGAQTMVELYSGNKKLLAEARTLLANSRRNIEFIRMQQLQLRNMSSGVQDQDPAKRQENLLLECIEDIRHHIRVESAVLEGSENMMKHLRALNSTHKKALQEAENTLSLARAKLELLRLALDLRLAELPADSRKRDSVHQELQNMALSIHTRTYLPPVKIAAVTGQLNVRLFGCEDLVEDVGSRVSLRDALIVNVSDYKPVSLLSREKIRNQRDDQPSNEVMASVYLDNKLVKQTDWKSVSRQCWDLKFTLDLDRSRELVIMIVCKDHLLCAVKFLRLEDFLYGRHSEQTVNMEPQGVLHADFSFHMNSMVSVKPNLRSRWHFFRRTKETGA